VSLAQSCFPKDARAEKRNCKHNSYKDQQDVDHPVAIHAPSELKSVSIQVSCNGCGSTAIRDLNRSASEHKSMRGSRNSQEIICGESWSVHPNARRGNRSRHFLEEISIGVVLLKVEAARIGVTPIAKDKHVVHGEWP
jgi:hypothetical protein